MIKRNFDRVWGQNEDMFQDFREKMESDTQRALLKVDEEVSTLRTQLQNQSPPSTRIGAGDQTSHHVAEFRERDNNSFNQVNPNPYTHNEIREPVGLVNGNFTCNNENVIGQNRQNIEHGRNVNPQFVTPWPSASNPYSIAQGSQHSVLQPRRHNSQNQGSVKMKPQCYDGSEDLDEYLSHFEILSDLNSWGYETKSLYLAGSLKGDARTLLTELSPMERRDFQSLVKILNLRFGSVNRAEIFKANLQTRVKRREESISELAQSIKKWTRQAYPNAPSTVISTLARDHFIDALPESDMRLRIREGQAKDIAEAEILALRLEAYRVADRQKSNRNRGQQINQVGSNPNNPQDVNETLVKSIMDGFRQECKSLTNDIKQVVNSSECKQPVKENKNEFNQNNRNNQGSGSYNPHNNGQRSSHGYNRNQRYGSQNTFYKNRNDNSNSARNVQGNLPVSNTRASVRPMGQGPNQSG